MNVSLLSLLGASIRYRWRSRRLTVALTSPAMMPVLRALPFEADQNAGFTGLGLVFLRGRAALPGPRSADQRRLQHADGDHGRGDVDDRGGGALNPRDSAAGHPPPRVARICGGGRDRSARRIRRIPLRQHDVPDTITPTGAFLLATAAIAGLVFWSNTDTHVARQA